MDLLRGPADCERVPGTHHIEARTFKDVFPRFRTMQGYHVNRKGAGTVMACRSSWRSRKSSGSTASPNRAFGIDAFNARCRESVLRHVDLSEQFTDRMGYWIDMRTPTGRWTPSTSSRSGGL